MNDDSEMLALRNWSRMARRHRVVKDLLLWSGLVACVTGVGLVCGWLLWA